MTQNTYKHDVFISYRRVDPVRGWVQNHFYPTFEQWFKESIPHTRKAEASVYIDQKIETGSQWADELRDALLHSRCLICIWSPTYFRQKWCLAEWFSMLEREKLLKERFDPHLRLIYPVIFNDGDSFPETARSVQYIDMSKYNCPEPSFRKTRPYVAFHKQIEHIAQKVAEMVLAVPDWEANWPLVDTTDAVSMLEPSIPLKRL